MCGEKGNDIVSVFQLCVSPQVEPTTFLYLHKLIGYVSAQQIHSLLDKEKGRLSALVGQLLERHRERGRGEKRGSQL